MASTDSITEKRWFMGKGRKVRSVDTYDSCNLDDNIFTIVKVDFADGNGDYYSVFENEDNVGIFLAHCFGQGKSFSIQGNRGIFAASTAATISQETLLHAKPLNAEQSNSAFFSKGEFFFKLYRRLQAGRHPETEILEHLSKKAAAGHSKIAPEFYGNFYYTEAGTVRDLGILEEHIPDAQNAWDLFTDAQNGDAEFYQNAARQLGRATAAMHKALKDLEGTEPQPEEVPYEKLIGLLTANNRSDLIPVVERLRQTHEVHKDSPRSSCFAPQRIHGDYHLGQLLYKGGNFIVLDFEGEPTRTLEYRRRLRSPAVDIAGMLRSFAYASAVRKNNAAKDCGNFEQITADAFLQGYSEESGIPIPQLKEETSPYVLGKAIYEACYELEFRPDWFWIPERALKN